MRLKDKVALITGASSGIGEKTAEVFAAEGAKLVIVARRADKLEALAERLRGMGAAVLTVTADVTRQADCENAVKRTVAEFGGIDVLVNNAGIADKHRSIKTCDPDWWDHVILVNQTSVYYMLKEVMPHMEKAGRGSVINVSSIGGVFGTSGISYSAAKSAVIGMTKNIAVQYAGKGVRCNAVCPGPTPTELNTPEQIATFDTEFADKCQQFMNFNLPQCTTEDQANAILFFASDEARAVTGQILIVDNGITL